MNLREVLEIPELFLATSGQVQNVILEESGYKRDRTEKLTSVWSAYEIIYRSNYLMSNDVCIAIAPYSNTDCLKSTVTVDGNGKITMTDGRRAHSTSEISNNLNSAVRGIVIGQYPVYPDEEFWIFIASPYGPFVRTVSDMKDTVAMFSSK